MDPSEGQPVAQTKVSKTERLLNLISFMLKSRLPIPFSKIAGHVVGYDDDARLDSIEKRFDRDKAELRNMGIPVEYIDGGSPEASGYLIPRERFFLRELQLDQVDSVILRMAARSGAITFGSPLMKDAFGSALRKLAVDAPETADLPAERASLLQVSSGHDKVNEVLQTVCSAVYSRRTIAFRYRGRRDSQAERRRVNPFGLGIDRGEWYLAGHCHDRDDVRLFRLSRVQGGVNLTGASDASNEFEIPKDFRIENHLFREPWDFGSGGPTAVVIETPRDLALQLRHQSRTRFDFVNSDEDGTSKTVQLRFDALAPDRMIDWLVSLGPQVRVIEPQDLQSSLAERVQELLTQYEEPGS